MGIYMQGRLKKLYKTLNYVYRVQETAKQTRETIGRYKHKHIHSGLYKCVNIETPI